MINKVILVGNVGADPEIRHLNDGLSVARVRLATSETYTDKNGQSVTNTEWHRLVIWRGLAKVVEQYVKKGQMLYVEGKITTSSYDKNGETRYSTDIVVSELRLLGGRRDAAGSSSDEYRAPAGATAAPQQRQQAIPPAFDAAPMPEDDLPF